MGASNLLSMGASNLLSMGASNLLSMGASNLPLCSIIRLRTSFVYISCAAAFCTDCVQTTTVRSLLKRPNLIVHSCVCLVSLCFNMSSS